MGSIRKDDLFQVPQFCGNEGDEDCLHQQFIETAGTITHVLFNQRQVDDIKTLQHRHALSVYPHFVGRLLFIYSRYCSFSLNIHNSRTDYFPKMCTSANALMLGVIVLLCFKIPASFIFLSPIVTIYLFTRKKGLEKLKACTWEG